MPRPKGSKNRKTLLKEAVVQDALAKSTDIMMCDLPKLVKYLMQKALDGDMQAAKMILDRCVPVRKSVEHIGRTAAEGVSINIRVADPKGVLIDGKATAIQHETPTNGKAAPALQVESVNPD